MVEDTGRIRFEALDMQRRPQGKVAARVTLAWNPDRQVVGEAEDDGSEIGQLRCAATATANALEHAVDERVKLSVMGIRTIQAFDAVIVVVLLAGVISDHAQRVVGSALITGRPVHAAARAVLAATNRLLGESMIYLR